MATLRVENTKMPKKGKRDGLSIREYAGLAIIKVMVFSRPESLQ